MQRRDVASLRAALGTVETQDTAGTAPECALAPLPLPHPHANPLRLANLKQSKTKPWLCFGAINCRALICQRAPHQLAVPQPGSCGSELVWGQGAQDHAASGVSLRMPPLLGHKTKSPCDHRAQKDGSSTWEPGKDVAWLVWRGREGPGGCRGASQEKAHHWVAHLPSSFPGCLFQEAFQPSSSEIILTWDLGYQETLN